MGKKAEPYLLEYGRKAVIGFRPDGMQGAWPWRGRQERRPYVKAA